MDEQHDVDGLNAGYARALLDEYLDNPEAVPSEWRALFESGDSELVATHPGIARLLEKLPRAGNGRAGNGTRSRCRAPPRRARRAHRPTCSCSAASPPRWRSSRRTARTATSRPGSTRSARSRSATRRSSRCGSSRS